MNHEPPITSPPICRHEQDEDMFLFIENTIARLSDLLPVVPQGSWTHTQLLGCFMQISACLLEQGMTFLDVDFNAIKKFLLTNEDLYLSKSNTR